jgi:hypothetical protein
MTKQEIQVQYHTLCTKVGDLYMKLQAHQDAVKVATAQMNDLLKERVKLEEAIKTAVDEPAAPVDSSN